MSIASSRVEDEYVWVSEAFDTLAHRQVITLSPLLITRSHGKIEASCVRPGYKPSSVLLTASHQPLEQFVSGRCGSNFSERVQRTSGEKASSSDGLLRRIVYKSNQLQHHSTFGVDLRTTKDDGCSCT